VQKQWSAIDYEVGREKIREFVEAVDEPHAIHRDRDAARDAGFRDVVAPPMFAVVYSNRSLWQALDDPEVGIDLDRMLHVGQDLRWGEPVCAGDVITTKMGLEDVQKGRKRTTYLLRSQSRNGDDDEVVDARWTMMVIGG
jgi:acyl dehydratase